MFKYTKASDTEMFDLVKEEYDRASDNIEMIASESTVPYEVMELNGSIFTNKTLEGYPGNRFQAGSEVADKLELLLNRRALELYGADHCNMQVYSGVTANYAVYASVLRPGDKVLSMSLDHGGHLSHGSPANFLTKVYDFRHYGVNRETELIDYDDMEKTAREWRPKLIIAGGSSYPRLIDYERFSRVAKETDAIFMVDMAHVSGLVAAKVIPSPIPFADFVTSSTAKTLCGPRSGMVFCREKFAKALDKGVFPGSLGSIHLNTMAAKAWSLKYASTEEFRKLMERVLRNAKLLARALETKGFRIVSGNTDNHIVMVDLRNKKVTGKTVQRVLDSIGITVNKNQIPFDPEGPFVTSGIRIGTTCVSQRGFGEREMVKIANIICDISENPEDQKVLENCRNKVKEIISEFPLYTDTSFFTD